MSVENISSGLVSQGQKASDYDNSDPVPPRQNVVPTRIETDRHIKASPHATVIIPDVHSYQPQSHDYRWTRDHLRTIRGNPTMQSNKTSACHRPEIVVCFAAHGVYLLNRRTLRRPMAEICMDREQCWMNFIIRHLKVWELGKEGIDVEDSFAPVARVGISFGFSLPQAAHKTWNSRPQQLNMSSSKLVPKVVPLAVKTATSRQELELLFHHHIAMLRTTGINPMIQPEPEDLPKDNPKLEIAVLRWQSAPASEY
ncbi:hypothetical protein Tco_0266139 [Tanacetum coccineum]